MSQGLKTQSERILQIIPEGINTPGVLNAAATPVLFSNGDHDWSVDNTYDNLRAAGYNVDEYNVVIEQMSGASFDFVPYYNLIDDQLLQFIMDAPSGADDATAAGARTRNWYFKQSGRINRRTFTTEEGIASSARRAGYGLVPAASITSERGNGGKTRSKMTMIMQSPVEGVAMTGQTTQNEIQTFVTGAGYAGGPVQIGAQNGGVAQSLTPGTDNLAAIQTKVAAALNKTDGHIVATGSSVGATAGAGNIASPSSAPTFSGASPWSGPAGTYQVGYAFANANGETLLSPLSSTAYANGNGTNTSVGTPSFPAGATSANIYIETAPGSGVLRRAASTTSSGSSVIINNPPSASAALAPTSNTTSTGGTAASLNVALAFSGASVANLPQNLITSATAGVTVARTQQGSNGVVLPVTPMPITPDHWKVYRATTLANLGNAASFIGTTEKLAINFAGLVEPHFSKDRSQTYNSHVDGGKDKLKIGASITLPTDDAGHCRAMQDGALAYVSTPQWIRFEAVSPVAPYKLVIDMYVSVGESVPYEYNGNIEERRFPLTLLRNAADGFCMRVTTVVAA